MNKLGDRKRILMRLLHLTKKKGRKVKGKSYKVKAGIGV